MDTDWAASIAALKRGASGSPTMSANIADVSVTIIPVNRPGRTR
jgi:hypothetical protein